MTERQQRKQRWSTTKRMVLYAAWSSVLICCCCWYIGTMPPVESWTTTTKLFPSQHYVHRRTVGSNSLRTSNRWTVSTKCSRTDDDHHRLKLQQVNHQTSSSNQDTQINDDNNNFSCNSYHRTMNRRVALLSALFIPMVASAAAATAAQSTTTTTPNNESLLENIQLGVGRWQQINPASKSASQSQLSTLQLPPPPPPPPSSSSSSSTSYYYSPTFCTYAARFLIRYDTSVNTWWTQLVQSVQEINDNNIKAHHILQDNFGSFSKTLERAFYGIPSSIMCDHFVDTYVVNNNPEVARQIAILFALLPANQQPTSQLEHWYKNELNQSMSKQVKGVAYDAVNTWQQLDRIELLPENFYIRRLQVGDAIEFTIQPPLALYDDSKIIDNSNDAMTALMTLFGPMSSTSLIRGIPHYSWNTYALLGIAGAASCALTHTVVIPLDVVKTRAQTDPDKIENSSNTVAISSTSNASIGMLRSSLNIIEREGVEALLLGAQATIVGYFWYGLSVYPSYTFAKQFMSQDIFSPTYTMFHGNEIALVAGAFAAVVASFGLTPIEAARIRVVADPMTYRPLGVFGTLNVIATENPTLGWMNLYTSLPSLLTRQVIFGSTKFLMFERACEFIYKTSPQLHDTTWTCLAVTVLAGGFSGVVSSIVSQPADSVLTYIAKDKRTSDSNTSLTDILIRMNSEGGIYSLFRGLRSRCLWAGSIIAGQFFLYDIFRTWFGVSSEDLTQYYHLLIPDL